MRERHQHVVAVSWLVLAAACSEAHSPCGDSGRYLAFDGAD
jgi:hypothetical protein